MTIQTFRVGINSACLLALYVFVVCGCASDFNGEDLPGSAWEFDERAPPISPAEIPLPIEWHYLDERNASTTRILDPWGEDAYRFPMTILSSLFHEDKTDGPSDPLLRQHFFLGLSEPFFGDGKLHMFEASPIQSRYNAYRIGQLVLGVWPGHEFAGQVLYEEGVEPRRTPYPNNSPEHLPEPLASWEASGEWLTDIYIYVPAQGQWIWHKVARTTCEGDAWISDECIVPHEQSVRDRGDHRIVPLKVRGVRFLESDDD